MLRVIAFFIEIISFLSIVVSPLLIGSIIGVSIYFSTENTFARMIGVFFIVLGLILGIIWGLNRWKKQGTTNFMSKINASTDLDEVGKE